MSAPAFLRSRAPALGLALVALVSAGCSSLGRSDDRAETERTARIERENVELRREMTMRRMNDERRRQRLADGSADASERVADRRLEAPRASEPGTPIDDGIDSVPLVADSGVVEEEIEAPPIAAPPASAPDDASGSRAGGTLADEVRSGTPMADLVGDEEAPAGGDLQGLDAQALYDRGYALFHRQEYAEAETVFRRFLDAHPTSELADNALFWVGECRYARGDLVTALEAFGQVVDRYPTGNKVPDAMLKAGATLDQLGRTADAVETYREILRLFPRSAASLTAQERLDALR